MLVKRETPVIPVINYYDFPDTKKIGGTCINDDDAIELLNEDDPALHHMELYAKVAVILFCPFFALKDIQDTDGNFLPYFRQFMREGKLKEEHQTYLFNAQDCRNRFNSMRPKDSLETTTKRPRCKDKSNNNDNNNYEDDEVDQMDEDFYDTYLENMECIEPEEQYTFNDRNDIFKVDTSTIRWAGQNKCGVKNIKILIWF